MSAPTHLARRQGLQALLWVGWTLTSLLLLNVMRQLNVALVLILLTVGLGCWLASEALRAWALRAHWLDLPPWRLLARVVGAPLLLAALVLVAVTLVAVLAFRAGWVEAPGKAPTAGQHAVYVTNTAILLWLWLLAWGAVQYARRWRLGELARWQAEAAQRALELEVLRAQVNPHFLFNALNNLRALIAEDPTRAREMVGRISAVLRHTLTPSARERVPLAGELAVVRDHLTIEQVHLEERLRVDWQLAPGLDGAQLPPMVLQLLVENAIKHGIARTPAGGELGIAIAPEGECLAIRVSNPGRFVPGDAPAGLGLAHLRERLARAGGPGARCDIATENGRVTVHLSLTP